MLSKVWKWEAGWGVVEWKNPIDCYRVWISLENLLYSEKSPLKVIKNSFNISEKLDGKQFFAVAK